MLNNCYTFNELKEKFQWVTNEGSIDKQIRFARNRGVEIEKHLSKAKLILEFYQPLILKKNGKYILKIIDMRLQEAEKLELLTVKK